MHRVHAGFDVWADVSPWFRRARGKRKAAISYVSDAAHGLLALRADDWIIVNASPAALQAGATNPTVLRRWHREGVRVLNHEALHAKVLISGRSVAVGSANASARASTHGNRGSSEAVIVTDDATVVCEVRAYVDALAAAAIPVDDALLNVFDTLFRPARGRGLPGITGQPPRVPLVPDGRLVVHMAHATAPSTPAGRAHFATERRHVARAPGLTLDFYETATADAVGWEPGHLLAMVWPEADEEQVTIGRIARITTRRAYANVLYYWDENRQRPLAEVRHELHQRRMRWPGEGATVTDQRKASGIVACFGA